MKGLIIYDRCEQITFKWRGLTEICNFIKKPSMASFNTDFLIFFQQSLIGSYWYGRQITVTSKF
jgi:hypothetical protein